MLKLSFNRLADLKVLSKKWILLLPLTLLIISCTTSNVNLKNRGIVRFLSYNVRNCRGMDNRTDYQRIAAVISSYSPDVAALQELDSATERSKGVVVLDTLASLTGMYKSFSPSIEYQGGKYGVGILSREKPLGQRIIPLPGSEEKRSLLIVEFRNYYVGCTHFSLTGKDREASAELVNKTLGELKKPVLLGGDFNAVSGSPEISLLESGWQMFNHPLTPTSPADNPRRCIDYIFGSKLSGFSYKVKKRNVGQEPVASDHLPVFTKIRILSRGNWDL